jgi:hypothetical protein
MGDGAKTNDIYVWPNPYRTDQNYQGQRGLWAEGSPSGSWSEYDRKIRFANLPPKCIIRIYTLDGDLVKQLSHNEYEVNPNKKTIQGGESWDMINRNDQSVVSGIYVFSVENLENGEVKSGKFVIIK